MPWFITGGLGYTYYLDMYQNDGQSALGRFAIGKELFNAYLFKSYQWCWGIEAGVQTGNNMRLNIPQIELDELGGLPISSEVKPMVDLLATIRSPKMQRAPILMEFKGGIVLRHWQFSDRSSINDKLQLAGEIQTGPAWIINNFFTVSLLYQGIFGSNPDFQINESTSTAHVSNIPIQHSGLVNLTLIL